MSRADRWWRPAGQRRNARPAVRSARRARYAATAEFMQAFDLGMDIGEAEERKRHRDREDMLLRLADASQAASDGDPGPMDELRREMGWRDDDLLDVAEAAGATPTADVEPDGLVDEAETYLRTYAAVLDGRTVEQLDDDESRALCTALGQVIAEITSARLGQQGGGE